jgi:hypothetical protein
MAYIGRDTDKISNVEVLDNITFDGSSSYTLQKNGVNFIPSSANTDYQAIQEWIADGGTYIYMAFAEQPLVGDNPATAR